MSKFKTGDRVRHIQAHSDTVTVLAIQRNHYWVQYDDDDYPSTASVAEFDRYYEPTPEAFLTYGGKFKPGDRVQHTHSNSGAATILAVHGGHYWMQHDDDDPFTATVVDVEHYYEPKEGK